MTSEARTRQIRYNNEAAPHQGAAFLFMLFARQAALSLTFRTFPLLYVPFFFDLAFFFIALFLAVGPRPDRKHGVGQMNAA